MKRSEIKELLREIINEDGAVGNVSGAVGAYSTPNAFARKGQKTNVATKTAENLGYKPVKKKKYPYSTKMFDYKKF